MIPYFRYDHIPLGPLNIQVWGLFVATGIAVAAAIGYRQAKRRRLDPETFLDLATWIVIGALVVARLFHAFVYEPAAFLAEPLRLFRVWEGGMSSYGGFLGAAIAAALYVRAKKVPFWPYADIAAYALPCGYGIGRIGCFLIHDHPGTLSHSLLAVDYPGGPRLDHGLLLSILGFAMFAFFYYLDRARGKEDRSSRGFLPLFMVFYGVTRFFLDFYRAWDLPVADSRYLQLTPAQYGSVLIVALGLWWLRRGTATRPGRVPRGDSL